eukprot:snap_masked-scaffold_1-processed-gene-18.15-mRNA-1 protein AED:0.98 eAED:1.00 QI:0/-1/0/1/-1/1/1/0/200
MQIRDLVRFSIKYHPYTLTAIFLTESFHDAFYLGPKVISFGLPGVLIWKFYNTVQSIFSLIGLDLAGANIATTKKVLDFNHYQILIFAAILTLEKLYLVVKSMPRPKYNGFVGSNFQRWINWHFVSFIIGLGLKHGAQYAPNQTTDFLDKCNLFIPADILHLYMSAFLSLELLIGITVEVYIVLRRYLLKRRARNRKKNK